MEKTNQRRKRLGDFNAKIDKKDHIEQVAGKYSIQENKQR